MNRVAPKQGEISALSKKLSALDKTKNADSVKWVREQITTLDKEVTAMQDEIIGKYPNIFFTKLLLGMREPNIPEAPTHPDGTKDSLFPAIYYKQHYWDNFDFNDNKLAYSEIFHNKLKLYFNRIVIPHPGYLGGRGTAHL